MVSFVVALFVPLISLIFQWGTLGFDVAFFGRACSDTLKSNVITLSVIIPLALFAASEYKAAIRAKVSKKQVFHDVALKAFPAPFLVFVQIYSIASVGLGAPSAEKVIKFIATTPDLALVVLLPSIFVFALAVLSMEREMYVNLRSSAKVVGSVTLIFVAPIVQYFLWREGYPGEGTSLAMVLLILRMALTYQVVTH